MSAVIQYKSSDPSAPVLTGQVGTLTNLLNQCLVVGYAGRAAAGWSRPFTATNQSVFKGGAASTGLCLQVLDDASGTGLAKEAKIRGYEVMTSTIAGTGLFSTSEVGVIRKSATTNSTPREWMLFADDRSFYLYTKAGEGTLSWWNAVFFGDIISAKTDGDQYGCAIIARAVENSATEISNSFYLGATLPSAGVQAGHWLARSHSQVGAAVNFACMQDYGVCSGAVLGGSPTINALNMVNIGVALSKINLVYTTTSPCNRGVMPGLWVLGSSGVVQDGFILSDLGGLPGKTFLTIDLLGGARILMETSSWR